MVEAAFTERPDTLSWLHLQPVHGSREDVHVAAARAWTGKDPARSCLLTERRRRRSTTIYILLSLLFLATDLDGED